MTTPLHKFYEQLETHDWHYEYSDDHHVWARGMNKRRELEKVAMESVHHLELFYAFKTYMSKKGAKPPKPPDKTLE